MENSKKAIERLFAVIAAGMAMLLCGLLLGCYEKSEKDNGSTTPAEGPPPSILLKSEMEEKDEYDIDGVSIDLIYGIDIDKFNSLAQLLGRMNTDYYTLHDYGIYVVACDSVAFHMHSPNDVHSLYDNIISMDESRVKDGVYLIEEIPCGLSAGCIYKDAVPHNDFQFDEDFYYITADNLRSTEYEAIVDETSGTVRCYRSNHVQFPRELFSNKRGKIEVRIMLMDVWEDQVQNLHVRILDTNGCYKNIYMPVSFNYEVDGDKVKLANVKLGEECVVDGTAYNIQ